MRSRHRNYSIPEELHKWIEPVVQNRLLGFASHASVITEATRLYILRLVELGLHPWGTRKETPKELQPATKNTGAVLLLVTLMVATSFWLLNKYSGITGMLFLNAQAPNIPDFYNQYFYVIDFFLYALLFSSMAYVTIGRKYGHSGLAVSLGMILAFSLTAIEPVWGFSLKSLGPLALILLLFIIGYLVYGMLRTIEMGVAGSFSIALLLIYLGFIVYQPGLTSVIREGFPLIDLVTLAIIGVAVWKGTQYLTSARKPLILEQVRQSLPEIEHYYPSSKESREITKKYLEKITKETIKGSDKILAELAYVTDMIDRFGTDPDALKVISRKLNDILPRQHRVEAELDALQNLVERLRKADISVLRKLQEKYKTLTPEQHEKAKAFLDQELTKINIEDQINTLKQEHDQYETAITQTVENASSFLSQNKIQEARKALLNAITQENKAREQLLKIIKFQAILTDLANKEISLQTK